MLSRQSLVKPRMARVPPYSQAPGKPASRGGKPCSMLHASLPCARGEKPYGINLTFQSPRSKQFLTIFRYNCFTRRPTPERSPGKHCIVEKKKFGINFQHVYNKRISGPDARTRPENMIPPEAVGQRGNPAQAPKAAPQAWREGGKNSLRRPRPRTRTDRPWAASRPRAAARPCGRYGPGRSRGPSPIPQAPGAAAAPNGPPG